MPSDQHWQHFVIAVVFAVGVAVAVVLPAAFAVLAHAAVELHVPMSAAFHTQILPGTVLGYAVLLCVLLLWLACGTDCHMAPYLVL
jgi:hypothetical protein